MSRLSNDDGNNGNYLRGVRAISTYLNMPERAARHIIRTGRFPYFRMGTATIWARKSDLDKWIDDQVRENTENGGPRPPKGTKPSNK